MEKLACKATGSKKAPKRAAFTLVMTSMLKPGELLSELDQEVVGSLGCESSSSGTILGTRTQPRLVAVEVSKKFCPP